jgi:hypothetical protein
MERLPFLGTYIDLPDRNFLIWPRCKRTEPPVPPEVRPWLAHPCQSSSVTVTKCTMGISQMQKVPSGGGETLCSGWGPDLRTRRSGPSPIKPTYVLMGIPYIGFVAVAVTST